MHAAPTQPEPANGRRAARQQASVGKAPGKASKAPVRTSSPSKAPARTASLGASASAPHAAAPTVQTLPLASRGLSRADLRTWESRDRMLAARSYHNEWTVRHKQRSVTDMATLCSSADAIAENARRARGGDARIDRRKEEALREIAERGLLKAYEADGVEMGEQRVVGEGGVKVRVGRLGVADPHPHPHPRPHQWLNSNPNPNPKPNTKRNPKPNPEPNPNPDVQGAREANLRRLKKMAEHFPSGVDQAELQSEGGEEALAPRVVASDHWSTPAPAGQQELEEWRRARMEETADMLNWRQAAAEKVSAEVARTALLARQRLEQQQALKAARVQEKQAAIKAAKEAGVLPP